ncbi:MAG: TonB-dependent receptor [Gammaproteobacteria bacterium]|nr:TonB-dependent receptor [Gammaproteobacteria bacterium]
MKLKYTCLSMAVAGALSAQAAEFNGKIVNHTKQPIVNAIIEVEGSEVTAKTDADGQFSLDLPKGSYKLDIKGGKEGHFHQSIEITDSTELQVLHLDENHEAKLVILANPLEHTKLDMAAPAIVLSGDELVLRRSNNLGEMLELEPGMSMSSFGPSVARPVIRGLSGGRVLITSNQMTVQDASTTSADHDVSIEPLLANQVEVIKGPATLLYGSGAIGGVVNVVDSKINPNGSAGMNGGVEARLGDSATGERSIVGSLTGGDESFAWHVDFFDNQFDDLEIPGMAESEYLHEAEGHEEEEGEEEGGTLENSSSDAQGASLGLTWNGDWGYFGFAINQTESFYGVPGHAHHEEEPVVGEPVEEDEEGVFIDLEQTRYNMQASINRPFNGIKEWFIGTTFTDYEHVELEGEETGTLFSNEARELRTYMQHDQSGGWDGIFGLQYTDRDFSAIGDEAFVPPSQTESSALFIVEEKRFNGLKLELGARIEQQTIRVNGFDTKDESMFSFSSGIVYDLSGNNKIAINFAHAERAPNVEELFSFGEHAATQTFEMGTPSLDTEISNNFDISYRFEANGISGEINGYWNQFDGFIYGANEFNNGSVVDFDGNVILIEEDLPIIRYLQNDAKISGVEVDLNVPLVSDAAYGLNLGLMADFIEAELDSGPYLPRIPALKYGFNLQFDRDAFLADLSVIKYDDQKKIDVNELPTDGFTMVNLELAYRVTNSESDTLLFLRGKNLLDEEARDHTSFIKDLAPRAGRNFVAGIRYQF